MPSTLSSDAYAAFVEVMKEARANAGLTQAELAERLNQPQSLISKNERRERRIDVVEFLELAGALGVDPGVLLRAVIKRIEAEG